MPENTDFFLACCLFYLDHEDYMNIREICGLDPNYSEINREERNYSAIFYAALMKSDNSRAFLNMLGASESRGDDFGVYFEYAYLRDIWSTISDERTKKNILRRFLPISNIDDILARSPQDINQHFGVGFKVSKSFIQQPGRWALSKYDKTIPNEDDFLKVCKFKWSFNIKPDIVIHLDKNRAICIEAKYESGEGQYPGTEGDKAIFNRRNIPYVGQMELQKYMMEELLGIQTEFVFLVYKKSKSETHTVLTWRDVFARLDTADLPKFARTMISKVS
jgi:hypothetical protein